jgi:signal transduction histidine kinase
VTDDGPRVPEELREALFDRDRQGELKRAKARRGRGLALPFAWAATKLMGGSIRVEDAALKDGAGEDVPACRFVVSLPVAPPRERPAEAPSRLAAARAPGAFASGAR